MLVIDQSGSLKGAMDEVKALAKDIVDLFYKGSTDLAARFSVVSFNETATIRVTWSTDDGDIDAAIDAISPDGMTSISAGLNLTQELFDDLTLTLTLTLTLPLTLTLALTLTLTLTTSFRTGARVAPGRGARPPREPSGARTRPGDDGPGGGGGGGGGAGCGGQVGAIDDPRWARSARQRGREEAEYRVDVRDGPHAAQPG